MNDDRVMPLDTSASPLAQDRVFLLDAPPSIPNTADPSVHQLGAWAGPLIDVVGRYFDDGDVEARTVIKLEFVEAAVEPKLPFGRREAVLPRRIVFE